MKKIKTLMLSLLVASAAVAANQAVNTNQAQAPVAEEVVEMVTVDELPPVADKPVVIDFSATWCAPCRDFAPTYNAAAKYFADKARFVKMDVDQCKNTVKQLQINSVPQVAVLFNDSTIVMAPAGALSAEDLTLFIANTLKGNE